VCCFSRPVQDTDASTWEFSEALIPRMKAQADRSVRLDVNMEPGEEGPIPPVHEGGLASHLGLTYAEINQNASIGPSLARTLPSASRVSDFSFILRLKQSIMMMLFSCCFVFWHDLRGF
jgi:hypothetical protein